MMGLSDPILEDAKDVIKSGNWKKDRQYNDQKKRTKTKHRILKIEQYESHKKPGMNSCAP
jgi:hypothetical protein